MLMQGETGTGKGLVARTIHQMSSRRDKPFVALDCGAAPGALMEAELFGYEKGVFTGAVRRKNGYFQLAQGGTLFLDEITILRHTTQTKLLRVLDDRRVLRLGGRQAADPDVRILATCSTPSVHDIGAERLRQHPEHQLVDLASIPR